MALTPPNNNKGDFNTTNTAPVPWEEVASTNHEVIDRNDMPFASTVEYKGYYKATATGNHTFALTGPSNVTGYSWLSSAPRNSDHIQTSQSDVVSLAFSKSYGIIIPNSRGSYWPFEDRNVIGTSFIGYGYWPQSGYGNSSGFNGIYSGSDAPSTACGYTGNQAPSHQYLIPGDIRTYGPNYPTFENKQAGPGWQGPEDPNFTNPCWSGSPSASTSRPLVRLRNTDNPDFDANATPRTMGKTSQIFLDNSFKAEGISNESWATFERTDTQGDHVFVWPSEVNIYRTGQGKSRPERVNIRFGLRFSKTDAYTFEFKTRDSLKIWSGVNVSDARNFDKFEPTSGINPCNRNSGNTSGTGWRPGGWNPSSQDYGEFSGSVQVSKNQSIQILGHASGVPGNSTHGFSLVVKDSEGNTVWTTEKLLTGSSQGLVGIDECGYHALLTNQDRTPEVNRREFYKDDGWLGYTNTDVFRADDIAGDSTARDPSTTRQYLWSNAIAKTRGSESIPGSVYLRQGDYYFIRTIISNHENKSANYRFTVTSPTGGIAQSVKFSGNGDPNSDTGVGGNNGGNGVPISPDALCDSVLAPGGVAIGNNDVNFAVINRFNVVLNLNDLNVSDFEIGREGQAESLPGGQGTADPGSKNVKFDDGPGNALNITISRLVRGGQDGLAELTQAESQAVDATYTRQLAENKVLNFNTFRSAISSQAVIQWGFGGNYPYIYHAVSEVIASICTGEELESSQAGGSNAPLSQSPLAAGPGPAGQNVITEPDTGLNAGGNNNQTCVELNLSQINSSAAQITNECFDECKTPQEYEPLLSQYKKNAGDYSGTAPGYYDMIQVQSAWGMRNRFEDFTPSVAGYGRASNIAITENIKFPPGVITSVPFTVPDVFFPDNFLDQTLDASFGTEVSTNTSVYNPNNASGETGSLRPYLACWISNYAGGPPLGLIQLQQMPSGRTFVTRFTANYDQFIEQPEKYIGYTGNIYGVKFINFATLDIAKIQATNFAIPNIGSPGFVDKFSAIGYSSEKLVLVGYLPVPDCSNQSKGSQNNSNRSAPDMRNINGGSV